MISVATQSIQIGKGHAGKTVTVHVRPDILRVDIEQSMLVDIPRTSHKQVARFKVRADERLPAYTLPENLGSFVKHQADTKRKALNPD